VTPGLVVAVVVLALLLAGWAVAAGGLGHAPPRTLLQALLGLQLVLLLQLAVVVVRLAQGERPVETGPFFGYLVLSLLMLPGGLALSVEERNRNGTLVLAVACLTVAVVEWRLDVTWR
jgi:hypothetical protein